MLPFVWAVTAFQFQALTSYNWVVTYAKPVLEV